MKRIISILTVLLVVISLMPIYAAPGDIVDIAAGIDDFSVLVAALQKAELVEALQGDGPYTVFAPTNQAFEKLLGQLGITAEDLLNHPQLSDVLLYHVVSGKVMSTDLTNGLKAATLQGEEVVFDLSDGVKVNMSGVVTADVEATNGVIHIIDTVLVPSAFKLNAEEEMMSPTMDIVDIALGNEDFSMLVSLLQKADLVSTLQGDGPFTVFAPTNQAFEDLLKALDITASELMAQPDLAKVLLYHVVPGKVMSTDLVNNMKAATAEGSEITINLDNGVMVNSSNVLSADIEASNGVVHVIDSILVPASFALQNVEMQESLPKTGVVSLLPLGILGMLGVAGFAVTTKKK
jgi:uncharacterized surface protein with fasciclin (FAS1) repeats